MYVRFLQFDHQYVCFLNGMLGNDGKNGVKHSGCRLFVGASLRMCVYADLTDPSKLHKIGMPEVTSEELELQAMETVDAGEGGYGGGWQSQGKGIRSLRVCINEFTLYII